MKNIVFIAILLFAAACGGRGPSLASLGPDVLYADGIAAYEAGDYDRAIRLLQYFVQEHVADERAPQVRMILGQAHAAEEEYITAAAQYQRFLTDYPANERAVDARYGVCLAYVNLSPDPDLDQEYTHAAIAHCSAIVQYYPDSEQAALAQAHLDDLRMKLARKGYQTGEFYLSRKAYDAAVIYFTDVANNFADTTLAPAALKKLVETYTLIGYVEEAAEAKARLLEQYPESAEAQALRG
ncbi:MAG TPA: outer membrane protein assembly factor BamD [Longimicrobiaceae bacterium]|nr:outer membrane protein assembly factor BamD [Longimicrobiaceae bacterium]